MIVKTKKEFLEKIKEIIEKIKQQKKGEAEQSYLIGIKALEVGMGITKETLNTVGHILGGSKGFVGKIKDGFEHAENMFRDMDNKINGVIYGVKGNKETAEVAFIGGIKDVIDEMNNAGKKWIDDMKEKFGDGAEKVDRFLKELEKKQKEMKKILDKLTGEAEQKLKEFLNNVEKTQDKILEELKDASKEGKKHLTEMLEEVNKLQDEIADKMKEVAESADKIITDKAKERINNAEKRLEEIRKKLEN